MNGAQADTIAAASDRCLHCSLPIPSSFEGQFCCAGCEAVYRTMHELGLQEYYRYKAFAADSTRAASPTGQHYLHFDDQEFQKHIHPRGTLSEVSLYLEGVHCAACVWLIERLPQILPGIQSSRLNLGTGRASIIFDSGVLKLSELARTLDSLGYVPVPFTPSDIQERERVADRQMLLRIGVAAVCSMNAMVLAVSLYQGFFTGIEHEYASYFRWMSFIISLPAILYSGFPFYRSAFRGLQQQVFHIDLPIAIGIIGATLFSFLNTVLNREYIYYDSVTTLIFLLLFGRWIQKQATRRARAESRAAWFFLPAKARLIAGSESREVSLQSLVPGDLIEIRAGERVPADATVTQGISTVDRSVLTGESVPTDSGPGDEILAGTLNVGAVLQARVDAVGARSRLGKILSRVEQAEADKPRLLGITDKVSSYFVVAVLLLSAGTFFFWYRVNPLLAIDHTLSLVIITCPCALGLATPAALSVALGRAARQGILIKGADTVETLASVRHVFMDKTGTVTKGELEVVDVCVAAPLSVEELALVNSLAQATPHHPASKAISVWLGRQGRREAASFATVAHMPGKGIEGSTVDGRLVRLGSLKWLGNLRGSSVVNFAQRLLSSDLSLVGFSIDGGIRAIFGLDDTLKENALQVVAQLRDMNRTVALLSGDREQVVHRVAAALGIDPEPSRGNLFPEDKGSIVEAYNGQKAFIGDGINDALAMKKSDVSVGLRGGIEATLEAADVFLAGGNLEDVIILFRGADRTLATIRANLVFSLAYNLIGGTAAIVGLVNPLVAAVLMPISSLTVVGNSIFSRTFETRKS